MGRALCVYLQCRRVEEHVGGLRDVSGVDAVVIWNILEVVVLQGPQKVHKHLARDLEGFYQVSLLQPKKNVFLEEKKLLNI